MVKLRRLRRFMTALLFLGPLFFSGGLSAADHWNEKLANLPNQFIFGYGSLINSASRNGTLKKAVIAIPVRVSAQLGLIRSWNARSASGFTALGLRHKAPGEQASTVNGVIYPVENGDLPALDDREKGYHREEVPLAMIEPASWLKIPAAAKIWVYVPDGSKATTQLPDPHFPLLQSYIDLTLEGALEYGENFARELVETTSDWSEFWLNDRVLPRRPWVHEGHYEQIDAILAEMPPASNFLEKRQFPEEFSKYFYNAGIEKNQIR